jgi:hypothetical protein
MRDVVGMFEGHWTTHFVSFIYSSYNFQWSFFQTTWNYPFFPHAVGREDRVCRS